MGSPVVQKLETDILRVRKKNFINTTSKYDLQLHCARYWLLW